jgi:chromosome partitioning protein
LSQLLKTYHLVKANLNPELRIEGILMTMYDGRTNLAREVEAEVVNFFAAREKVFESKIPRNIRLAEAPSHGLPISHYSPGSLGALAYSDLAEEIMTALKPKQPLQPFTSPEPLQPDAKPHNPEAKAAEDSQ